MSPILQGLANGSARGYGAFVPLGAAGAFESIASASGTGSSATITFSSIPSTYQHLQFRILGQNTRTPALSSVNIKVYFNGVNSGTGYAYHQLKGDGSTATAAGFASQPEMLIFSPIPSSGYGNTMGVSIIDIQDYASTSRNKTIRALSGYDGNGAGEIMLTSGFRASTDAITSVSFLLDAFNWTTTTTIALYGIKGA